MSRRSNRFPLKHGRDVKNTSPPVEAQMIVLAAHLNSYMGVSSRSHSYEHSQSPSRVKGPSVSAIPSLRAARPDSLNPPRGLLFCMRESCRLEDWSIGC